MTRFCPKCGRIVRYNPYFDRYICVQCGTELAGDVRGARRLLREAKRLINQARGVTQTKRKKPAWREVE